MLSDLRSILLPEPCVLSKPISLQSALLILAEERFLPLIAPGFRRARKAASNRATSGSGYCGYPVAYQQGLPPLCDRNRHFSPIGFDRVPT
jgi:hypothetical protein